MSQKKFERAQSCENSYQHQSGVSEEAQFINKPEKELKFDVKNNIQMNQEEHILFEHKNQISQLQQKNTSNQNQDHLIRKNDYQISQNIIQVEGQIDLIQNDSLENNLNVQKISKIECSKSEYVKDLTNKMTQDQLFNEEINISSNSSNSDSEDQQYQILNVSLSYQEQFYDRLIQNPQISQDSQFPNQINSSSGYMGSIHMNECEIEDNQNKLIPQNEKLQQDFISDQHSHTIHKKYKLNVSKQAKQDILKKDEDFTKKLQDQKKRILQEKLFEKLYKQDQYELIQKQDYLSKLFREQAQLICQKLREKKYILKKFNESIASLDIFFGYSKEDRKQDLVFLIKYFDQDQQPSYIQQEPTQGDQQTLQNNSLNCSSFYDKLKEVLMILKFEELGFNEKILVNDNFKIFVLETYQHSYIQKKAIEESDQIIRAFINEKMISQQPTNRYECQELHKQFIQLFLQEQSKDFFEKYLLKINQITDLFDEDNNKDIPYFQELKLYYYQIALQINSYKQFNLPIKQSQQFLYEISNCQLKLSQYKNALTSAQQSLHLAYPLSGYDVPCGTPSSTGISSDCNTCVINAITSSIFQPSTSPEKLIACAIYLDNTPEMSYTNCCSQPLDKNCSDQMQSRRCPYCKASGNFQVAENISDYSRAYN
ncbi:hypothetical protein ABPG73_011433 [Tetrahymena malaccensis]